MKSNFLFCAALLLICSQLASCKKSEPDVIPEISFTASTAVNEGNGFPQKATVALSLSEASAQEVRLKWSTQDGTAKAGADYIAVKDAKVVFAPGETSKNIEISLTNDEEFEFDDEFIIVFSEVKNAVFSVLQTKVIILNDDTYTPEIAADGPITPEFYPGMKLVWNEDFTVPTINTATWTFEKGAGGWGNNELQEYTDLAENAFISDGKLNIVATKTPNGGYRSARMITKGRNEFTYGRIDIRAKLPVGQGIWPALWMLGSNISQVSWPACGEIDIMEYLGHDPSRVYGTAHYNNNGHLYKGDSFTLPEGKGFNEKFHVFTILWQENSIIWYVDYQKYFEVTSGSVRFDAFRLSQFFIFNVAVGGNWPGSPNTSTVFPQTMQVDYVRVFQSL